MRPEDPPPTRPHQMQPPVQYQWCSVHGEPQYGTASLTTTSLSTVSMSWLFAGAPGASNSQAG
eukprot:CAMPEP_0114125136 /NCGR_PEP_ID=MMETSP0043_2-20121206/9142_1 /TAXON_ID=464988 /ORGANISM="Hemiselmis andersenii, Strain CCMP644" /LENGTH=62 /DNA_ID=CAMNT_0001218047 /DNA_START=120 /DNA_END=308 /DNA_ORIENTATION=-